MSAAHVTAREALNTIRAASGHLVEDPNEFDLVRRLPNGDFLAMMEDAERSDWMVGKWTMGADGRTGDWTGRALREGMTRDEAADFMFAYVPRTACRAAA